MARISLKEQYDNKDVIKQIYDLTVEVAEATVTAEKALENLNEALAKATEALNAANDASEKTDGFATDIETAQQDAELAQIQAEEAHTLADKALQESEIVTGVASATLRSKTNNNITVDKEITLASESATGMMSSATYQSLIDALNRITALEGKASSVYVSFPSDNPTQTQITAAFTEKAGRAPQAGDIAIDIARSLTYQFDGSTWIQTQAASGLFTNATAGLIRGTDATGEAGTIFAEGDGTGSVNGWDALVTKLDTFINSAKTAFSGYSIVEMADQVQFTMETLAGQSNLESIPSATAEKAGVLKASDWSKFTAKQNAMLTSVVELTVAGWASETKTISVAVDNVTESSIVWVSPAEESFIEYFGKSVRCSGQSEGALTFTCEDIPETALTVNVVIG